MHWAAYVHTEIFEEGGIVYSPCCTSRGGRNEDHSPKSVLVAPNEQRYRADPCTVPRLQ